MFTIDTILPKRGVSTVGSNADLLRFEKLHCGWLSQAETLSKGPQIAVAPLQPAETSRGGGHGTVH